MRKKTTEFLSRELPKHTKGKDFLEDNAKKCEKITGLKAKKWIDLTLSWRRSQLEKDLKGRRLDTGERIELAFMAGVFCGVSEKTIKRTKNK